MKVVFYFGVFAQIGGIEEFTRDLALALRAEKVDVEILCAALRNPILDDLKRARVSVVRIPIFQGCRWGIPDYALLPAALFKMRQADVVIHQKPFHPSFYRLFPRKVKHVYITAYRPAEQFPDLDYRTRFFSFFDLVLTQAHAFAADLFSIRDLTAVEVLPYIPLSPFMVSTNTRTDRVLRVGMMGRLEPQKNPMLALEIVSILQQAPPRGWSSVEFHVHGAGTLERRMRAEASKLRLTVVFHGTYDRPHVPTIVANNQIFLITSVSEGQCIVALEILAGGRPLFATPVGALPTILNTDERGALLPMEHATSGARVIREWLETHRSEVSSHIQESYLRDYDPEYIKRRYVTLFKALVGAE